MSYDVNEQLFVHNNILQKSNYKIFTDKPYLQLIRFYDLWKII